MVEPKVVIPEVWEPDEVLPQDLLALRRFAFLMDAAVRIPGTRQRVGLDAAIGLIPGGGDIIGGVMSAWIIVAALRHRVRAGVIGKMLFNIFIDVSVGAIPILGDVFDFFFTENIRNLQLLFENRDRRRPPRSFASIAVVAVVIIGIMGAFAISVILLLGFSIFWIAEQRL